MTKHKKRLWALTLALAGGLGALKAQAAGVGSPSYLNIDVTVNSQVSVAVNGVNSSTYGVVTWNTNTPNQEFTAGTQGSSVTVTNDSNVVEKWWLSASTSSFNVPGNAATWTVSTTSANATTGVTEVGADAFALQAVFGSSGTLAGACPANAAASWNVGAKAPVLKGSLQQYMDTQFADTTVGGNGALPDTGSGATSKMTAAGKRVLCWRALMPASTSTSDQQNIQLVVTATQ